MIKVKMNENSLVISGHAGFANYGNDIVCASVSSIVIASANDMMTVNKSAISYNDDGNELIIKIIKKDELVEKLLTNLKTLLDNLADDYPANIKIESEE